jgi:hypothetical protein
MSKQTEDFLGGRYPHVAVTSRHVCVLTSPLLHTFFYTLRFVTYFCTEISSLAHADSRSLLALPIWESDVYNCKTCFTYRKQSCRNSRVCHRMRLTTIVYGIMTAIRSVPLGSAHKNVKYGVRF